MMSKTGYTCIRRSLCLLNFFFWVIGAVLIVFGLWLNLSFDSYSRILSLYHILSAGNLLMVVGFITFFISLCGLCGSWFQNKYLLGAFLSTLIIIMVLEIVLAVMGYLGRETVGTTLREELMLGIKDKYDVNNTNGMVTFWDTVQEKLDCCGVDNFKDWYYINAWKTEMKVPKSCCKPSLERESHFCVAGDIREHGCYSRLRRYFMENLHYVAIVSVVFAFIQFFAVVTSLLMLCTVDFKKQYRPVPNPRPSTYNRVPTL